MQPDYSAGFSLNDLDAIIGSLQNNQEREYSMIMGFKMAWDVTGRRFNHHTTRKWGKVRLIKHKYIGTEPSLKYLRG